MNIYHCCEVNANVAAMTISVVANLIWLAQAQSF